MEKRFFAAHAVAICALSKLLIIPVLAQAATPVQPVWLNASTPDDQRPLETLAGFTDRDQLFVSGISGGPESDIESDGA
ncbi:MAG: hypothetical protein VW771_06545 [Gammaproteobacteria bacterium]